MQTKKDSHLEVSANQISAKTLVKIFTIVNEYK